MVDIQTTLSFKLGYIYLFIYGGNSNTLGRFMLRKPELSTGPMDHLGPYKGFLRYI